MSYHQASQPWLAFSNCEHSFKSYPLFACIFVKYIYHCLLQIKYYLVRMSELMFDFYSSCFTAFVFFFFLWLIVGNYDHVCHCVKCFVTGMFDNIQVILLNVYTFYLFRGIWSFSKGVEFHPSKMHLTFNPNSFILIHVIFAYIWHFELKHWPYFFPKIPTNFSQINLWFTV